MQTPWRTFLTVASLVALSWTGAFVLGQNFDAPQYPQYVQYPQSAPPVTPGVAGPEVALTPDQIDQLLAPIALYPDPLLSLIFPAATYPQQIVAAEQWVTAASTPTEDNIAAQNWDASVKGLVHYPTVLKMMNDQIDWTQALGAAFLNQQPDVLASVQRLRAEAKADGSLQDTQQAQVITDGNDLRIEPVNPDEIFVPTYNPNVVYTGAYPIDWGAGYPIGLWCDNDFDWGSGYIVVGGGWYRGWHHPADWDRHTPDWDHHPAGWKPQPQRWARSGQGSAPRLTAGAVNHLNLNRPRPGGQVNRPAPARPEPQREPAGNVFDPVVNRDQVQRYQQRARPAPAPARAPEVARPAPRPPVEYRPPPPPPPRAAPNQAFGGGSAAAARAQSSRGQASRGRR
jgi:hypothetical protein